MQAYNAGQDPPEKFLNQPELNHGLFLYYNMFWELVNDRPVGFAPGTIQWMTIHVWCRHHELSYEQEEDAQIYLKAMDAAYLEHCRKKENDNAEQSSAVESRDAESGEGD